MLRKLHYGISEQAKAAKHRLDDAHALFEAGRWRGTLYMAGYHVECLLKTKLMQVFSCRHLQELEEELQERGLLKATATVFTHELEELLGLTQASKRLQTNNALWRHFNRVNRWVPAWRYAADLSNQEDAEDFLESVEAVGRWIENNI